MNSIICLSLNGKFNVCQDPELSKTSCDPVVLLILNAPDADSFTGDAALCLTITIPDPPLPP